MLLELGFYRPKASLEVARGMSRFRLKLAIAASTAAEAKRSPLGKGISSMKQAP